ncbi:MAG TPA: hypothetical protein P5305_04105 [Rubrivivax sp.]|nr:hypothetical protein [Rubrivivax sp.]HRY87046.1 hypothetical protein [Rubrivivax sp.]
MALKPEQIKQAEADYAAAFDEDMQSGPEPTEDEAFGLGAEPAAEQPAAAQEPVDIAAAAEAEPAVGPGEQTAAEAQGDEPGAEEGEPRDAAEMGGETNGSAEGADQAVAVTVEAADLDKERQRLKSWEGRLRKIEADLKAKADAEASAAPVETNGPVTDGTNTESQAADALEQVADQAEGNGDTTLADGAEQAAEQVESGEMTATQAMKQLAEDFGEDFVRMIEVIAAAKAREAGAGAAAEKIGELGGTVDEIIADIRDGKARAHFSAIASAHPDFDEIGRSEGFAQYVDSLEGDAQAEAMRVAGSGSADEIIKLLGDYKASLQGAPAEEIAAADEPAASPVVDQDTDQQLADAEGVRSSGMKLPETPAPGATSYEDAWKEFS